MAVTEPRGNFDYLLEGLDDTDEGLDEAEDLGYDDEDLAYDDDEDFEFEEDEDYEFGADSYPPPPAPWYRTSAAMVAFGAIAVAGIAILVSGVLLVSRNSRSPAPTIEPTIPTAATPSSAAPETPPPVAETPPPSPAESPSPTEPSASAPVVVAPRQTEPARPPQIGVTRTNITRLPYSVKPPPVPHF